MFVKKIVYSTDENDIETKCLGGGPRAVDKGIGRGTLRSMDKEMMMQGQVCHYTEVARGRSWVVIWHAGMDLGSWQVRGLKNLSRGFSAHWRGDQA